LTCLCAEVVNNFSANTIFLSTGVFFFFKYEGSSLVTKPAKGVIGGFPLRIAAALRQLF